MVATNVNNINASILVVSVTNWGTIFGAVNENTLTIFVDTLTLTDTGWDNSIAIAFKVTLERCIVCLVKVDVPTGSIDALFSRVERGVTLRRLDLIRVEDHVDGRRLLAVRWMIGVDGVLDNDPIMPALDGSLNGVLGLVLPTFALVVKDEGILDFQIEAGYSRFRVLIIEGAAVVGVGLGGCIIIHEKEALGDSGCGLAVAFLPLEEHAVFLKEAEIR